MDPVTLITTAVIAGTQIIGKEVVSEAAKEGYTNLMQILRRLLDGNAVGKAALEKVEKEPEAWKAPLQHAITEAGADKDTHLVAVAKKLMEDLKPQMGVVGKNAVQVSGKAQGFITGDNATQTNTFNSDS